MFGNRRSARGAERPGKRRRRWIWVAGSGGLLLLLALVGGCSILSEFKPEIDTPDMRSHELASAFVDTPEGKMHVVSAGLPAPAARRVLFVHGSPGTWDAWKDWMEEPALRERARLLAPDRIGFGGSERGHAEGSLERQAASLAAVLEAEGGGAAVVVGHSLGGPIAARLAMDRPDLVSGLLLVAPSIDPAMEKRRWYNVAGATWVVQWFLPVDWITSNRELWPLKKELSVMLPAWHTMTMPVIVVQGTSDDLVPPENADFAEKVLEGRVEVKRYPGMGHFILWQKPESVTEPILDLLNRAAAGTATKTAG